MLARIEESYLNILRVAIVATAGLVLLIAVGALVAGATYLGKGMISSASSDVRGGELGEFIAEKRLLTELEREAPADSDGPAAREPTALAPPINEAAAIIALYLNREEEDTITKGELVDTLNSIWLSLPEGNSAAYEASLLRLARQLAESRGRPLDRERVLELIRWHHQSIVLEIERRDQETVSASANAWSWLARSGQAFLLFVVIAFYFLLVRVERHLRLVRIETVEPGTSPAAASEDAA